MINLILDKQPCKMEELKWNMINNNNNNNKSLKIPWFCHVSIILR